jgi:hypothetical protein
MFFTDAVIWQDCLWWMNGNERMNECVNDGRNEWV